jgi:hypothetical protein
VAAKTARKRQKTITCQMGVTGFRLCRNAEALKRLQKVWKVHELPTQATSATALVQRGG